MGPLHETKTRCWIACEQALRDALGVGRKKEGELATTSLEFEYLHRKSRCEMLISGNDVSNGVITLGAHVLSCVFQAVVASSSSFSRHAARTPRRAYSQATCWMAHDALGQEKKLSLYPFQGRTVVCPSARYFCTMKPFRAKGTLESWKKRAGTR